MQTSVLLVEPLSPIGEALALLEGKHDAAATKTAYSLRFREIAGQRSGSWSTSGVRSGEMPETAWGRSQAPVHDAASRARSALDSPHRAGVSSVEVLARDRP